MEVEVDEGQQRVTGITVVAAPVVGGSGSASVAASVSAGGLYLLVATSMGKVIRININKAALGRGVSGGSSSTSRGSGSVGTGVGGLVCHSLQSVMYYHTGTLLGLCVEGGAVGSRVVTGGDDRRICVWDSLERRLLTRTLSSVYTQAQAQSLAQLHSLHNCIHHSFLVVSCYHVIIELVLCDVILWACFRKMQFVVM